MDTVGSGRLRGRVEGAGASSTFDGHIVFFVSPPGKFGTLFGYIPIIMSRRLYKRIKYFPKNYASLFFLREQKFDYSVNGCLLFFPFPKSWLLNVVGGN